MVLQHTSKTPDEEALPFKSLWALQFNSQLRIYVEAEALHCFWNDLKNAVKRAELQPALLLSIVLTQMAHGPFLSGHHQWSRQETAQLLSESISHNEFQALQEAMLFDRYGEDGMEIPQCPEDIPHLSAVQHFPIFVTQPQPFSQYVVPGKLLCISHYNIFVVSFLLLIQRINS